MRGRLSREKWWVALFGGSGNYYIMEECAHCGRLAFPRDLVDDSGIAVKDGGHPGECTKCPECSETFRAETKEEIKQCRS